MGKIATLTNQDEHHKALAQSRLAQARRILRQLSTERQREERRRIADVSLLSEVRAILHGA